MRALLRSAVVVAASAGLVASVAANLAWAQGEWKADPKCVASAKNTVKGVGNAKKTVETNCVTCHGASGKGDGPAAAALPPPKPADWTSAKVQAESDAGPVLQDQRWARRHAAVEAPSREGPLGGRELHPHPQEVARRFPHATPRRARGGVSRI